MGVRREGWRSGGRDGRENGREKGGGRRRVREKGEIEEADGKGNGRREVEKYRERGRER